MTRAKPSWCYGKKRLRKWSFADRLMFEKLRSNGWTLQQIGDRVGLSRQRVHQLLGSKVFRGEA